MKICKSDILEKNSKDLKNKIQLKFQSVVIVKKLLVNFIPNFQFRANFVEKCFCKNCHKFDVAKDVLLQKADEIGKDYIENFIRDFLNISVETIKLNYKVQIESVPVEKTFKVKSYNKSEKNRIQVINKEFKNCEKISYSFKGKQRTFYKNSSQ